MNTLLEIEIKKDEEFNKIIEDLLNNKTVLEMKKYRQHYNTSCYDHCYVASYYVYKICKKHNLNYKEAARAAMLHDLFLYDWRKKQPNKKGFHAFTHGKTSFENACKITTLNELQKDMIIKHMWPVTLALPRYKETFILTFVDKYCALSETISEMSSRFNQKRSYKKNIEY